jgi:hypothetical protein
VDLLDLWFFVGVITGKEIIVRKVRIIIRGKIWGSPSGKSGSS